eukprot:CAMPEP_0198149490 /NCGR_PEP_ID=MMETSP1443-20131203/46868_1 /TAXON_ID=186043 /ORGANISM="Entomoneis sp., Strain CCMP2396" /LENGTH=92 /DNA_ID=CAMNT_0043814549 /DNA_START=12 /DNA_END=286 /DNA_ORIENTATION=+
MSSKAKNGEAKGEPGVKGMMGAIGKPFQKMRRRLTVTGSSGAAEHIDGSEAPPDAGVEPPAPVYPPHQNKYQSAVRCAVTEYSGVSKKGHAP